MKNKSAVIVALLGMLFLAGSVHAASGVRGSKAVRTIYNTTNTIGISSGAAVVYGVILGTGAVTDFVTLFDSNSAVGLTQTQTVNGYRMRLYPNSATANTVISFDPPVQFFNGLMVIPATGLGTNTIIWEPGRITQGY